MLNGCSRITHIDGIVRLHVSQLDEVSAHKIALNALRLTFDLECAARTDVVRSFLSKCDNLRYLELVDGTCAESESLSLKVLLSTALHDRLRQVQSLKLNSFILSTADVAHLQCVLPNVTALALDMRPTSRTFLLQLLSLRESPLDLLDLTFEYNPDADDLLFFRETSEAMLAKEVTIKIVSQWEDSWKSEYALRFPRTESLTVVFLNHKRNGNPYDSEDLVAGATIHTYDLNHLERLRSRNSFGMNYIQVRTCHKTVRATQESAPWIQTLHMAFAGSPSLPKFGVHERYSPEVETRALDIMRGMNLLQDLYDDEADDEGIDSDEADSDEFDSDEFDSDEIDSGEADSHEADSDEADSDDYSQYDTYGYFG